MGSRQEGRGGFRDRRDDRVSFAFKSGMRACAYACVYARARVCVRACARVYFFYYYYYYHYRYSKNRLSYRDRIVIKGSRSNGNSFETL